MRFRHVRLHAAARRLPALTAFYGDRLGLELAGTGESSLAVSVGETQLDFVAGDGQPFYHFALLAPGNRFAELLEWARERTELLPDRTSGDVVFDFTNWEARACYFHDPGGNIVELIAHRGIGETAREGPFAGEELLGLSELGLVGSTAELASVLEGELGLELWAGTVEVGRLAFVGEKARTLILSPEGRPWLPTGRPAEAHPIEIVLSGPPAAGATIDSIYRIRRAENSAG
jgi:catechol 2,3-dioxygenase-like lactoylglutathione lyase family enzyme